MESARSLECLSLLTLSFKALTQKHRLLLLKTTLTAEILFLPLSASSKILLYQNLPIFCLIALIIVFSQTIFALFTNKFLSLITHKIKCPLLACYLSLTTFKLLPYLLNRMCLLTLSKENCTHILTFPSLIKSARWLSLTSLSKWFS